MEVKTKSHIGTDSGTHLTNLMSSCEGALWPFLGFSDFRIRSREYLFISAGFFIKLELVVDTPRGGAILHEDISNIHTRVIVTITAN